jgi:phosphoenolpyruvate-protein kinase (PTS system EI component)
MLSHAMIGLVAKGIPTVLIDSEQESMLKAGSMVSVDGATGLIAIDGEAIQQPLYIPQPPMAGHPIHLVDRTPVWLMASVRNSDQAKQALISGASGIGLVRSEFLANDGPEPPNVARSIQEFENLCTAAGHLTVTVRLIDIAEDKPPRWLSEAQQILRPTGMQGVRLYTHEPIRSVVRDQLAALARLCDRFPIEVLIPFIGRRDELLYWHEFVRRFLPESVAIGAMAETPAAVIDMANWTDLIDFSSIGTNDLIQYYFAADRDEPELSDILDPYTPALYRLLQQVAETVGEYRERIRLCGVLPRLSGVLPVLVGLGFRRFSIDPVWIPYLTEKLRTLQTIEVEALANRVCACADSREVREVLGLSPEIPVCDKYNRAEVEHKT